MQDCSVLLLCEQCCQGRAVAVTVGTRFSGQGCSETALLVNSRVAADGRCCSRMRAIDRMCEMFTDDGKTSFLYAAGFSLPRGQQLHVFMQEPK